MNSLNITNPGYVILNSRQGGGKSHLLRYLMYKNKNHYDFGIVFCNTYFENPFDYLPEEYIHPEYTKDILKNFMDILAAEIKNKKNYKAFVIFDDCIDKSQFNCPIFKRLTTQLRHYNITLFISTQYVNILPPIFRSNAFQVAIFHSSTKSQLISLYESYGMDFENFNEFKKYIFENTGQYQFIWFDKTSENKYQIFKAPAKIPNFKIKY